MANIPAYQQGMDLEYYHQELNASLQQNISDNGMVMPSQSATAINNLATSPTAQPGTFWYDTTNDRWVGRKADGTLVSLNETPI